MSDLQDQLAQIRERLDRSKWEGDALDQIADLERSQADVPRLLAAVEAVLEQSGPDEWTTQTIAEKLGADDE